MEQEDDFDDLEASLPCPDWSQDDEALAYYLATARYGGRSLPVSVREEMERITLAAREDEELARRIRALSNRMDELDSGVTSGFESLAERRREPVGRVRLADRPAVATAGRRRRVQRIAFAVPIAVLLVYAGFVLAMRPELADLAVPGPLLDVPPGALVLRGESPADEAAREQLAEAHALLVEARGRGPSWFARYDDAALSEAIALLQDVRVRSVRSDPMRTAAAYLLAKAYLADDNPAAAWDALVEAADGSGPAAAAARELSAQLEARLQE